MKDENKTKKQLIQELRKLRRQITRPEVFRPERPQTDTICRTLIERSLQGAVVIQDFRIVFANPAFAKISGYTLEELISLTPKEVRAMVHPGDKSMVWGRFRDRLAGKRVPSHYEYRGIRKDGSVRWLEIYVGRIQYAGKPAIYGAIVDITERKKVEEELLDAEITFRALAENATDGILIATVTGAYVYANKTAAEITGYSVNELLKLSIKDLTHPDEHKKVVGRFKGRLSGKSLPRQYETIIVRKDGRSVPIELTAAKTIWQGGPAGLAIIRDITDRKQAEEALRKSEILYRATIDSMDDIVHVVDKNLRITLINPAFQRWSKMLKLRTDVVGRSLFEAFPFLPNSIRLEYQRVFTTGKTLISEEKIEIDGKEYITETRKIPVVEKGEVVRITTVIRDFTEHRLAERALRESEEKYRTLVEESLQGLVITQGFPPHILFANSKAAEIIGCSVEDVKALSPKAMLEMIHIEDQPALREYFHDLEIRDLLPASFEFRVVRKDKIVRWIETFSTNILYLGEPAVQTAIIDITERKEAERKLREREEYFSHLIQNSSDLIAVAEEDGTIRYLSPSVKQFIGYEPADLVDTNIFEHLHPQDIPRIQTFYDDAVKRPGLTSSIEHRLRRADGSWIFVESIGSNLLDSPVVQGLIINTRDISQRKKAEEEIRRHQEQLEELVEERTAELQRANEQLKAEIEERKSVEKALTETKTRLEYLLSSSPAVLYISKASGDYAATYVSENIKAQLGYDPQDFLDDPKFWVEHIHPEDRSRVLNGLRDALKRGHHIHEYRFLHRDGTYRWMRDEFMVTKNASGKREIIGYWIDNTDRKAAEEALRQSEETNRALLNASIDSALLLDLNGTFLATNEVAAKRLGKSAESLIGTNAYDLFSPGLAKSRKARASEVIRLRKPIRYEDERDGRIYDTSAYPVFDSRGKVAQLAVFARDITDRKRAEETLRKSEEKYRELADLLPQTLFEIDTVGNLMTTNRCGYESFGYTQKDLHEGLNVLQLFIPEDRVRMQQNIAKRVRGESIEDHEYTALSKDGRTFPVLIYSAPIVHDDIPVGLRGVVVDIAERKQAEEALKTSEEKWRSLVEHSPDAILNLDLTGRILFINHTVPGYSVEETIGKEVYDYIPPEQHKNTRQAIEKVLETGKTVSFETSIIGPHGNTLWYSTRLGPIHQDDRITGVAQISTDITERKRMELVQQVLQRIANAVHTTEDLSDLFKIIHLELGGILNTENFFIALLDKGGNTISFPYHKDERNPRAEILPARKTLTGYVIRHDKPMLATSKEIERLAKAGEIEILGVIPKIWLGVPMKARSNMIGALVVQNYLDETALGEKDLQVLQFASGQVGLSIQHKRAEEELKQTLQELARSNAELEQFAYVASHDLQEPLQAVAMSVGIVAKRYEDKLDKKADKFIHYAVSESNRMQMLVRDLLAYSRVGKGGAEFEPTDCLLVLDQTLDNLLVPIERSHAKITHGPLPTVMGDPLQLTQLFQNLIDNAIKFRGQGPPRIRVSARRRGDEWTFSVRDHGIGFDPQHVERIFKAFERLLSKTEYPGTGIGLAICRKIVERHGGRIWAKSEPGKGATFYFTIPAMNSAQR